MSEPWRCDNCKKLIYNLDENGHPAPGAPMPKYLDFAKSCCSVCFDMGSVLRDSTYFLSMYNRDRAATNRILGGNPTV